MHQAPLTFGTAFVRGLRGRCPHCGEGRMFQSFLKVVDHCSVCNEQLNHHRADDLPAYLVILITGHVIVPLAAIVEIKYGWPFWLHAVVWLPVCLLLGIGLLQPIKGAVVGIQWFMGMHGFMAARQRRLTTLSQRERVERSEG